MHMYTHGQITAGLMHCAANIRHIQNNVNTCVYVCITAAFASHN